MFRFKQFSIKQDKAAMKVGTDGVLLASWTPLKDATSILDVGTGTGLIALMLAQRNTKATIHAIEVEEEACQEAFYNFSNAPWADRIQLFKQSFLTFAPDQKYDLIVSNPPYFTDTFKDKATERTLARHVGELNFKSLLHNTSTLLKVDGTAAFVIPYQQEKGFVALARELGFFPRKITRVKGREHLPFKRSLLYFKKQSCVCDEDELTIEIDRHIYTEEYIALTQSFYLKM